MQPLYMTKRAGALIKPFDPLGCALLAIYLLCYQVQDVKGSARYPLYTYIHIFIYTLVILINFIFFNTVDRL